jgi:hypothetical protein
MDAGGRVGSSLAVWGQEFESPQLHECPGWPLLATRGLGPLAMLAAGATPAGPRSVRFPFGWVGDPTGPRSVRLRLGGG